jgi:hypothetical protein
MKKVAKSSAEKVSQLIGLLLGSHFNTPAVIVTDEYTTMIVF